MSAGAGSPRRRRWSAPGSRTSGAAWTVARLEEVPSGREIPVAGRERTPEEEWEALALRAPAVAELWTRYGPELAGRRTHDVRRFLGVTAFGVNAFESPAGERLVFPHDEVEHGHEEIYLVVRGRARYVCDGEEGELGASELLYVRPGVHRELFAVEPTLLFLVGGKPGAYTPPIWARDYPG
jgi:mannose-6-phosphate isomerase-like protein (cupin superfamily)